MATVWTSRLCTFLENHAINSSSQPDGGEAYLWPQEEESPGWPVSGHGGAGVPWHPGGSAQLLSDTGVGPSKAKGCVHTTVDHLCKRPDNLPLCQLPGLTALLHIISLPAPVFYFPFLPRVWSIYGCSAVSGKARIGK